MHRTTENKKYKLHHDTIETGFHENPGGVFILAGGLFKHVIRIVLT